MSGEVECQLRKRKSWRTSSHPDLPKWMQDNEFIHNYHRPHLPSLSACFGSVVRVHSETGNIWTHLLGFVAVSWFAIGDLVSPDLHTREKVVFGVSYIGSLCCLSMSTLFHILNCHSQRMAKNFNKLDYAGIGLMISASFITWLYYGFYCRPWLQAGYIACVSAFGIGTILLSLWDRFSTPQFRTIRASFFVTFGLFGLLPAANWLWLHGMELAVRKGIGWCALMAACYLIGAAIYASRMPERMLPGRCDVAFHSHQWLHIFVLLGMTTHFYGCKLLAAYVLQHEVVSNCGTVTRLRDPL